MELYINIEATTSAAQKPKEKPGLVTTDRFPKGAEIKAPGTTRGPSQVPHELGQGFGNLVELKQEGK